MASDTSDFLKVEDAMLPRDDEIIKCGKERQQADKLNCSRDDHTRPRKGEKKQEPSLAFYSKPGNTGPRFEVPNRWETSLRQAIGKDMSPIITALLPLPGQFYYPMGHSLFFVGGSSRQPFSLLLVSYDSG
jgi:hypothetical protein